MRVAARIAVLVAVGLATTAAAVRADDGRSRPAVPILFQPNVGQTSADAAFTAPAGGARLDLLPDGFRMTSGVRALRFRFVGGARRAALDPLDEIAARANYFLGSDPAHWHRGVPQYARVRYRRLYPGIDALFRVVDGNAIEFDFAAGDAQLHRKSRVHVRMPGRLRRETVERRNAPDLPDLPARDGYVEF